MNDGGTEMGYTHYWYRDAVIDVDVFKKIVRDFKIIAEHLRAIGVPLADGLGKGYPELNDEIVCFNGPEKCGHPKNHNVVIPLPSETASGIGVSNSQQAICGTWFAGATINSRCCNGDCSYETFHFPRIMKPRSDWDKPVSEINYYKENGTPVYNDKRVVGKWFACCKTAYRPYDLAVNCFLIIAKHYLGDKILVHSDGEIQHWMDGIKLCGLILQYGEDFKLDG